MIVEWTEHAARDLIAARDYVARNSPAYAQLLADRILNRSDSLEQFPHLGAEVPEYADESIRELLEHPYRIIYRVTSERVQVIAVVHGAKRLPRTPPI